MRAPKLKKQPVQIRRQAMDTIRKTENISQNRRWLLSKAAIGTMGLAVAGTAGLLPSQLVAASGGVTAQLPGIRRTDLMQYDLSVPEREVIQALVEIPPGAAAPRHSHPGEELVYVVEGLLEYQLDGRPPVTLKAGEVLFIPYGTIHAVKNVGSGNAAELATYFAEKGKPLFKLAE
jgi:quercetin dioxygenase-like cupin family protein